VQALGALFEPYTPPLKSTLSQMVLHRPIELAVNTGLKGVPLLT
jgi:hypothetical protein